MKYTTEKAEQILNRQCKRQEQHCLYWYLSLAFVWCVGCAIFWAFGFDCLDLMWAGTFLPIMPSCMLSAVTSDRKEERIYLYGYNQQCIDSLTPKQRKKYYKSIQNIHPIV